MVKLKPGQQRSWANYDRCQCGGRWMIPKHNGTFRIGSASGRVRWRDGGGVPIRANWPTVWRHVSLRGHGSLPYIPRLRLREFAICPRCGERNLKSHDEWHRRNGYLPPLPEAEADYQPPIRQRDHSGDLAGRKRRARDHKNRQARSRR